MSDTKYAYAVARIRAIETKLLDKSKIDRMIDAKSPEEALKVLTEAGYGDSNAKVSTVFEYERILKEENKKVYSLLKEIAPEPDIFDLFLIKNDYHNAKVILKAEFLNQDFDTLMSDTGSIPKEKLKVMIKERNMADIHTIMKKAIEESIDTFNRTGDPQVIDLILDKATFKQMKEMAKHSKVKFIMDLVDILIDTTNIKTYLRVKRMNKSWDFLEKALIPGGSIDVGIFIDKLESPLEGIVEALRYTAYGAFLEEAMENYKKTGTLTNFEKLWDDFVMEYVKKAKYISLGIEPLIGYLIAKENEIRLCRIIMVGKINGMSKDIIRERLREVYV